MNHIENRNASMKRERIVSGRIPRTLFDAARSMIDGGRYRTMNDVVETAISRLVTEEQNNITGGEQIAV